MNTPTLLHSQNLYALLSQQDLISASNSGEPKHYRKGKNIYRRSDISSHIYVIVQGGVKLCHFDAAGNEVVKSILHKGEIFGELALAGECNREDFATAIMETSVLVFRISDIHNLMIRNPDVNHGILKLIGLRLMKSERKVQSLVFSDARTRVIDFLKDTAASIGKKVGFEVAIFTKITHKDIADLTGTSRQTVTTILNELKQRNAINFDRRRILIRDLQALK